MLRNRHRRAAGLGRPRHKGTQAAKRVKWAMLAASLVLVSTFAFLTAKNGAVIVTTTHASLAEDFRDDRRLVGWSDDVFFAEVVSKEGSEDWVAGVLPQTQFLVRVKGVIKGSVAGNAIVEQDGGYSYKGLVLELFEGDEMLEPGKTYLLASRRGYSPDRDEIWHHTVPLYGTVEVASPKDQAQLRERFRQAYEQEIPSDTPRTGLPPMPTTDASQ